MRQTLILLALLSIISFTSAAHWAVLVAGSNGFWNYRHQADVCHAYNTLITKGLKAENIIVFAYDDVANDPSNPFPGQMFNKPTSGPGKDIYAGCKIDYKGADVNSANFLKVIKGDAAGVKGKGTGRVLKSTKTDRVFLNFADHGAVGLIAFPSDYLYANDLLTALDFMNEKKMYSELVFYLEACESGSMFQSLPNNTKVFATSAASASESSWGTYCAPDDVVNGKSVGSCLGDLYSVNWMEDTDFKNVCSETLEQQFEAVQKLTDKSHVLEWGDLSFKTEPAGDFTSTCVAGETVDVASFLEKREEDEVQAHNYHTVDSRDIKLFYLQNKYNNEPTQENLIALQEEEASRKYFDAKIFQFADVNGYDAVHLSQLDSPAVINFECLKATVESFEKNCQKLSDYALKHVKVIAHMCTFHQDGALLTKSLETVVCSETILF